MSISTPRRRFVVDYTEEPGEYLYRDLVAASDVVLRHAQALAALVARLLAGELIGTGSTLALRAWALELEANQLTRDAADECDAHFAAVAERMAL